MLFPHSHLFSQFFVALIECLYELLELLIVGASLLIEVGKFRVESENSTGVLLAERLQAGLCLTNLGRAKTE